MRIARGQTSRSNAATHTMSLRPIKTRRVRAASAAALMLLWLTLPATAETSRPPPNNPWIVFGSSDCPECDWLTNEFLPPLAAETELPTVYFANADNPEAFDLLVAIEAILETRGQTFPALFAGNLIVYGKDEVLDNAARLRLHAVQPPATPPDIRDTIAEYRQALDLLTLNGTKPTPATPPDAPRPHAQPTWADNYRTANVLYFETPGCSQCARTVAMLQRLLTEQQAARIAKITRLDGRTTELQMAVASTLDVPDNHRLAVPMVVSDATALYGEALTLDNLRNLIETAADTPFWTTWDERAALHAAQQHITNIGQSFSLAAIVLAGLLDGINPCAFAVMVFIVSYLAVNKGLSQRRRILLGMAFCGGVFTCYLLLGLGFSRILVELQKFHGLRTAILYAAGSLCILFAAAAAWDAIQARRRGAGAMRFGMPERFRNLSHRLIRNEIGGGAMLLGAYGLGVVVSSLELVCTGQIYLPILVFINSSAAGARSLALLLAYNVAFILPLTAVLFIGVYCSDSKHLVAWGRKHAILIRAAIGILLLTIGITLLTLAIRAG